MVIRERERPPIVTLRQVQDSYMMTVLTYIHSYVILDQPESSLSIFSSPGRVPPCHHTRDGSELPIMGAAVLPIRGHQAGASFIPKRYKLSPVQRRGLPNAQTSIPTSGKYYTS